MGFLETIPFVVNMIPCSIDNLVTNTANTTVADPASWPERADEIEGMELIGKSVDQPSLCQPS